MAVIFSYYRREANMLHHHSATRPTDSLFRVRSVSLLPRQPKSKSKEDLPQWVRRLVEYSWDYDRICLRVERQFPPPASTDRAGTAQPLGVDRAAGGGGVTNVTGALNLLRSLESSILAMRDQILTLIPQTFLLPSNAVLVRTVITVTNNLGVYRDETRTADKSIP